MKAKLMMADLILKEASAAALIVVDKKPFFALFSFFEVTLAGIIRNSRTKSLAVALFYGLCSISMNFLNKAVVSVYDFNFPFFIMACQMVSTIAILKVLKICQISSFPNYVLEEGSSFFLASFSFFLHATLSLSALHGMNIPMYGAVKRCTPIVNLFLSVVILRKALPSVSLVLSVSLITIGCIVASAGDLQFDQKAYSMGMLSVLAQGFYLTLVQRSSECQKSAVEMLYLNSINTLPIFTLMSFIAGEYELILETDAVSEKGFLPTFITLILSGCVLTFSQFLCASVCSALTTSLVGTGKSVIQTVIGFFTFGGVEFHPLNIFGLVLNIIGGFSYSYVKYKEGIIVIIRAKDTNNSTLDNESSSQKDVERGTISISNGKIDHIHTS